MTAFQHGRNYSNFSTAAIAAGTSTAAAGTAPSLSLLRHRCFVSRVRRGCLAPAELHSNSLRHLPLKCCGSKLPASRLLWPAVAGCWPGGPLAAAALHHTTSSSSP